MLITMEPHDPAEALPLAHLVALRLEQLAISDTQAAWILGIDPEGLGPLREVARRRLRELGATLAAAPPDEGSSG